MARRGTEQDGAAEFYAAFHKRLQTIAQDRSLSDIARKTGTSPNNVSRYLRGTRPPIDFCNALATKMGVNPAWLLTGEGTPWLTDIAASDQKTATDLLALINAMSAVTKIRLGALTGKGHLQVLRELNDALVRYEDLRDALRQQTRPIYEQLLGNLESLVKSGKMAEASSLEHALALLSRLCEDMDLRLRLDRQRSLIEWGGERHESATRLAKSVFIRSFAEGEDSHQVFLENARDLVAGLRNLDRKNEARSIGRAALALTEYSRGCEQARLNLEWLVLDTEATFGLFAGVPARMLEVRALLPAETTQGDGLFLRTMLLSGALNVSQALALAGGEFINVIRAMEMALWTEDTADLRAAQQAMREVKFLPVREQYKTYFLWQLETLLYAIEEQREIPQAELDHWYKELTHAWPSGRLGFATHCAQAARLAQNHELAKQRTLAAGRLLLSFPASVTPGLLALAQHHRNVIELLTDEVDQSAFDEAHRFFLEKDASGYRFLHAVAWHRRGAACRARYTWANPDSKVPHAEP